ncbi:ArsA family ATPase [Nocardia panacis]|uniref:ArsA family ATPase n=1 Tax=Nocardia panacis TaxID=2340916 RepID=A0A3A4KA40_9NOCA|nr:ArsA family ATPase [Nocardia panacis]
MGKGGVGKTTLACATALAAARAGRKVLIASLDQAHSLGDALGFRFPHDPGTVTGITDLLPNLSVIEVDSLALLEDRFRELTGVLSGAGHEHGIDPTALDPAELTGLPGVQELLMLAEITAYAADGEWELLLVDCPPTADMLRIVTAPETLLGYLERIWPQHARAMSMGGRELRRAVLAAAVERIVKEVTAIRELLADPARTGARLVTVPERVTVAESARVRSAAALLGLRLDAIVVNKVLPPMPDPESGQAAHPAVSWYSNRRAEQLAVIADLERTAGEVPVLISGHTGPEPVGLASLTAFSHAVDDDPMLGANPARAHSGAPVVRWESGAGLKSVYALRLHLPVVDPATLRLGRVEDDLIVGADGVRRRVRLAPVLRRCTVEQAELAEGYLTVRFVPDPEVWPI